METTNTTSGSAAERGTAVVGGTKDGLGAGDHDVAYRFGFRPSTRWTYPFTAEQYCKLLIMRGHVQDGDYAEDMHR